MSKSAKTPRIWAAAVALALPLVAPEARAAEQAVGLAPLGSLVPVAAVGGVITTIVLGINVGDGDPVHPSIRDMSLAVAGINILSGTGGLVAGALIEDDDLRPVFYSVGGAVMAIGLTGGVLGWVVDTYEVNHGAVTVQAAPTRGGACWSVSGSF
ncbi:MAG: hypothetical protein JRI68_31045 [Deltaproteobacteria bacterium]|nr:hypothetical protein [Deltaproteobacteria bacterium]